MPDEMPEPPPGGYEIQTWTDHVRSERAARERESRLYWNAIRSAEFRRAMQHLQEMSDAMMPETLRRLGLCERTTVH